MSHWWLDQVRLHTTFPLIFDTQMFTTLCKESHVGKPTWVNCLLLWHFRINFLYSKIIAKAASASKQWKPWCIRHLVLSPKVILKKEVCFDFSLVGRTAHLKWAGPTPTIYGLVTIPFVCKPRKCSILAHRIREFPKITSKHSGQIPLL